MLSELLAEKFKNSRYNTVKDWKTDTRCELSTETVSKVLLRGVEPGIPTFIIMAYRLGFTPVEISNACKAAGDTTFYKLIAPIDLEAEDKEIIKQLRALPHEKKKLVMDLLNTLGD